MTSPLKMTLHRPAGRLGLYVRAFQVLSTTEPAGASVLDFGGGDVSVPIRFGDPVLVEDWGYAEVLSAAVVGPRRQATWLRFGGMTDQVNVSFHPGAAGAFVGLPLPELVGRMAAPDDVWPHDFREAVAELEPLPPNGGSPGSPSCCWPGWSRAGNHPGRSGRRSGWSGHTAAA